MGLNRRRMLGIGLGAFGAAIVGVRCGLPALLRHGPPIPLEPDLKKAVDDCFADVDRSKVWDTHVHLVGRGHGTDCFVSPELESKLHLWKNFQFDLYAAAAGLSTDDTTPDAAYVERLLSLHRLANPQGKMALLAFDMHVDEDGNEVRAESEFYTPNEYVLQVAAANPDAVVPCASVHPYRKDAIERLHKAIDGGARAVKWLPNAMGIDPSSAKCDAFYGVLAARHVPLITHTGDEAAVDARDAQKLGDPRRLERALLAGVTVVAAHVATTGTCGESEGHGCFDVLRGMMRDARFDKNLFADISACTQFNRAGAALSALLDDDALHPRLVNGSDYPLPAIDPLVSTRYLARHGFLSDEDRFLCNRVFAHNPLLFDYIVKRKVRFGKKAFPPRIFETSWLFA